MAIPVRPFGRAADLDVAFEGVERPVLVTSLLERCSEAADGDAWWREPVGARIAALLRLASLSDRSDVLATRLRCPQPSCASEFEIALPIGALVSTPTAGYLDVGLPDGRTAVVRAPTGADQRTWMQGRYESRREAVSAIVRALIVSGDVSADDDESLAVIGTALAEADPLVDFTVSCDCPTCGVAAEIAVDLEGLALARLRDVRRSLLMDVHALASAYGWSEAEILALPAERRLRYRELVAGVAG